MSPRYICYKQERWEDAIAEYALALDASKPVNGVQHIHDIVVDASAGLMQLPMPVSECILTWYQHPLVLRPLSSGFLLARR